MAARRFAIPAMHAAWGAALLWAPAALLRAVRRDPSPAARRVLRVLGVRHMAQAAGVAARPGPAALRVSGAVDGLHWATCVAFAAASRRWRRPAAAGCLIAGALAAWEFTAAHGAEHR